MSPPQRSFTCLQCRLQLTRRPLRRAYQTSARLQAESSKPSIAPKTTIDIKSIRQNPSLYEQNCIDRNYKAQSQNPARIVSLFEEWQAHQREGRHLRERSNLLRRQLSNATSLQTSTDNEAADVAARSKDEIIAEARSLKEQLSKIEAAEAALTSEIDNLAVSIPNLTSDVTPRGDEPKLIGYINDHPEPASAPSDRVWRSHVHIGTELALLDFTSSATTSGWGWYYLLNEAALLEQALVQYSLSVAIKRGWGIVSPPSIVYSHIAGACGFQPRDQHGEMQIYGIAQSESDRGRKPEMSLAATAEIPLAGMKASQTIEEGELPMKKVGVSRCYRAEAGARGVDTKGLYRVHEFTKVEMFAWTLPSTEAATAVFDEMVAIQTEILTALGLHCRILEMPSTDLGASATRKRDIEAFFPSRRAKDEGWGEVTSASVCTDYQSRRLATRVRMTSQGGRLDFPFTVNGTAMAVPRVLAAILENGWDEERMVVKIPEVLRPWMGGSAEIGASQQKSKAVEL
jgi:seryl-tRNA synthetase